MKLTKIVFKRNDGQIEGRIFKGNDWVRFIQETGYELISN